MTYDQPWENVGSVLDCGNEASVYNFLTFISLVSGLFAVATNIWFWNNDFIGFSISEKSSFIKPYSELINNSFLINFIVPAIVTSFWNIKLYKQWWLIIFYYKLLYNRVCCIIRMSLYCT